MLGSRIGIAALTGLLLLAAARAEVGEFSIPSVLPLSEGQVQRLRELVARDAEAAALAADVRKQAEPLLGTGATPLEVIHYEGLVNTDPRRIETVASLKQLGEAATLVRYWQISGDDRAAQTLADWILAWTRTYRLTGNDVNENKFYPLLVAYHSLRDRFAAADRRAVDDWVRRLGELHLRAVKESSHFNNRYVKSVRLLAMTGMILDRPAWVDQARQGVQRFVRAGLYPDGTSEDLKRRDSLTYHGSALKKPLDLAIMLGEEGRALYAWQSERGGSLKKSVDYVVPNATGEKQHREWVDSQVDLDRRRAEAGLEKYRKGRLYQPGQARELMEKAAYFDPSLIPVVRRLTEGRAERFPTWQMLMNEAARPADMAAPSQPAE